MTYRKDIDFLRALAVLVVIFSHAGLSGFSGGYIGVDIFFVISGYLITGIITTSQPSFSYREFYTRRIVRIVPALYVCIVSTLMASMVFLPPTDLANFSASVAGAVTFTLNLIAANNVGYFDDFAKTQPLLHLWSLSVEEQFYLIYPVILGLLLKLTSNNRQKIVILSFFLIIGVVWSQYQQSEGEYYLLTSRYWELLAGGVAFLIQRELKPEKRNRSLLVVLKAISIVGLLTSVVVFSPQSDHPGLITTIPVLFAALYLFAPEGEQHVKILKGPGTGTAYLGKISYSLYLYHFPVFAFTAMLMFDTASSLSLVTALLLTLVTSVLSYHLVEQPLRRSQSAKKHCFRYYLLSSLGLITIAIAIFSSDGLPGRFSEQENILFSSMQPSPTREKCHGLAPDQACVYGDNAESIAVFGDSHAVELAYALAEEVETGVKHLSYSGCPPRSLLDSKEYYCSAWTHQAIGALIQNENIETIVVSYRLNNWLFGDHLPLYPDMPIKPEEEVRSTWDSYVSLINVLAAEKQVIVVMPVPELPMSIKRLLWKRSVDESESYFITGSPREWWEERNAFVKKHLADLPDSVAVVDPAELLCNADICFAAKDGKALYFDDDHLSVDGALLIAREIDNYL